MSRVNFVPGNKFGEPGFEEGDEDCDQDFLTCKAFRVPRGLAVKQMDLNSVKFVKLDKS